ncbi:MAG: carbon-nitrogen hydrolase family protein [Ktedonobacterales bacterium]
MSMLRVALLQMTPCGPDGMDQAANLAKGEVFCRQARQMGADIALFPEMWNTGYAGYSQETEESSNLWRGQGRWAKGEVSPFEQLREAREQWQALAINQDSRYVRHFQALALELEMAIAVTFLEQWPGAPRNSVALIDRHGGIKLTYAKVHTCDFDVMEAALTPGDGFPVVELDTAQGLVRVGAMICYDREFPESSRLLMLQGAELVLIPNACEIERHRIAQLHTRAIDDMLAVALTNYAAPRQNGHSIAFDPIAFDADGSRDTLVIEAGGAEGVYLATFDLDAIRDYRQRESWGNAFRRPHRYGAIASLDVEPPFVRVNERGDPYPRELR